MSLAAAAAAGVCVAKAGRGNPEEKRIPLMGVMGAFIFAGQMINFTIPGTGSSGHIGGGILLAALLGPYPAYLVMAVILLIQCLFFADGGLLAYGANLFNMGFIPCLLAFPLIFKPLTKTLNKKNLFLASLCSVVVGLQAGAAGVVLQTFFSKITVIPLSAFFLLMQPIHLAIGVVEGLITGGVLSYILQTQPEILETGLSGGEVKKRNPKKTLLVFGAATVVIAGILCLAASGLPDGLEWSLARSGAQEAEPDSPVHQALDSTVQTTALMPDYNFADRPSPGGTSVAGLTGSLLTLGLAAAVGFGLSRRRGSPKPRKPE
jgi:cobalt/nickel transport system permease protein